MELIAGTFGGEASDILGIFFDCHPDTAIRVSVPGREVSIASFIGAHHRVWWFVLHV